MRRKKVCIGWLFVAFGLALAVAFLFPARCLVIVLSAALILSGAALCRTC